MNSALTANLIHGIPFKMGIEIPILGEHRQNGSPRFQPCNGLRVHSATRKRGSLPPFFVQDWPANNQADAAFLRRTAPSPANPMPNKANEAGSGTDISGEVMDSAATSKYAPAV